MRFAVSVVLSSAKGSQDNEDHKQGYLIRQVATDEYRFPKGVLYAPLSDTSSHGCSSGKASTITKAGHRTKLGMSQ